MQESLPVCRLELKEITAVNTCKGFHGSQYHLTVPLLLKSEYMVNALLSTGGLPTLTRRPQNGTKAPPPNISLQRRVKYP
jgi:hypothetical protein